jgi:hypothetical protein
MLFQPNSVVGVPIQLTHDFESGTTYLDVLAKEQTYRFRATGALAVSLLRQVTRDTKGIIVEYDPMSPNDMIAFTINP